MENITEEQKRALESPLDAHCIVTAGPGSGKTFFLVHRVARILSERPGSKIYCISFTNESARELNRRLIGLKHDNHITCSTIHRFCLQGLKSLRGENSDPLRVTKGNQPLVRFMRSLVNLNEAKRLVQTAVNEELGSSSLSAIAEEEEELKGDSEGLGSSTAEDEPYEEISTSEEQIYSRLIDLCRKLSGSENAAPSNAIIQALGDRFHDSLRKASVIDLRSIVTEFLRKFEQLKTYVASVCEFVEVDEFQDLDSDQLKLLRLIAEMGIKITAVGDPNQSIYKWRREGVDAKRHKKGMTSFENLLNDKPVFHQLAKNLRSTPDIVRISNNLIGLFACKTENPNKGVVCGLLCRHVYDETARIGDFMKLLKERNELASCAVLFRYNFERERFLKNLSKNEIPYHGKLISVSKGPITVKRTKSLNDLLTVLKACTLWEWSSCWECLKMICSSKSEITRMETFLGDFKTLEKAQETEKTLSERVTSKSPEMKCKAIIALLLRKLRLVGKNQSQIRASLDLCVSEFKIKRTKDIKEFFEQVSGAKSLGGVLSMVKEKDEEMARSKTMKNGIFVGTIHAAKGREWKTVILPFLNEKSFPSERADIEEERRVMYVAMTRAADTLLVTCNDSAHPSPFLRDAKIPLTRNVNEFISLYTSTR